MRVPLDGSGVDNRGGRRSGLLGTPARPIVHDGEVFAAWLPEGGGNGRLWSSRNGPSALDYGGDELPDDLRPTFVASDDAVILNETRTGWVWTVPDGKLVASSQDWTLDERTDPDAAPSEEQLQVVIDPKPPIAEPDTFGVRAGSLVTLPVLMNDHDPNEDVLSIDPASVTGLDPGFGTVSITDDGQRLTVEVAPDAAGSAGFAYAVTDGTSEGGLSSSPVEVTLSVVRRATARRSGAASKDAWCPWPDARGRARRHRHRPGAAGLGRPRRRPAAAAVGAEHLGRGQRRSDARRRSRLSAQR